MAVYRYKRLTGPITRLGAADREIDALEATLKPISDIKSHSTYPDFDTKAKRVVMRALQQQFLKPIIGVRVGVVAHHLRGALDEITYQVARLTTKRPSRYNQFPIHLRGTTERHPKGKKKGLISHFWGDRDSQLRDITDKQVTLFERHQPYKRGNGHREDPLFLLKEMNDADKHRYLHITLLTAQHIAVSLIDAGGKSVAHSLEVRVGSRFITGAELYSFAEPPPGSGPVRMNDEIALEVRFGRGCKALTGRPVIPTLRAMYKRVDRIMRDTFFPVLKLP